MIVQRTTKGSERPAGPEMGKDDARAAVALMVLRFALEQVKAYKESERY
jgi:hypothetical protein